MIFRTGSGNESNDSGSVASARIHRGLNQDAHSRDDMELTENRTDRSIFVGYPEGSVSSFYVGRLMEDGAGADFSARVVVDAANTTHRNDCRLPGSRRRSARRMDVTTTSVRTLNELIAALSSQPPRILSIEASIVSPHSIFLPRGFGLAGTKGPDGRTSVLSFSEGGLGLTGDNSVRDLLIVSAPNVRAIFIVAGHEAMGVLELRNLKVTGQVGLIFRGGTKAAHVVADDVHVVACDARAYCEQPQKYGVNVLQGAFTLYHFNGDPESKTTATLTNIRAGAKDAPVIGSGVFISGFGDNGGFVEIDNLTTGPIYSNGMLTYGTADFITAGVFVVYGVRAGNVDNQGEVVTYGVNDMVLDNWGSVKTWTARAPVISYGPSGIGFVNFGLVRSFRAMDEIVTYGAGARGFNQYDGTVDSIGFDSITTHGDGSIGIQVSKPIGSLRIERDLVTHGSIGNTLVKGVNMTLPADALSVKKGGSINSVEIGGDIVTYGNNVVSYSVEGGEVRALRVAGRISANGEGAKAIALSDGGSTPLAGVKAVASDPAMTFSSAGGIVTDDGLADLTATARPANDQAGATT